MQWCTRWTKFLEMSSEGLFQIPSNRISHRIHIVRKYCCRLSARSGIFYLLFESVYWPCGLKFVYPTINLAFLGIIVKVKLPEKFCWHIFEWFCAQINSNPRCFFLSCPRHCDRGLIVDIVYYIQIWNKKELNIIISGIICSHMCPVYIEIP